MDKRATVIGLILLFVGLGMMNYVTPTMNDDEQRAIEDGLIVERSASNNYGPSLVNVLLVVLGIVITLGSFVADDRRLFE